MFKHITGPDLASLVLRLGLAGIFLFHGAVKIVVFGATEWNPSLEPKFLQAAVAWGEILVGIMCLFGVLSRLAAVAMIVIMAGAIVTVTGQRDFININYELKAGKVEPGYVGLNRISPGYEYNVAVIVMATGLVFLGSGPLSVDRAIWGRGTGMIGVLYVDPHPRRR